MIAMLRKRKNTFVDPNLFTFRVSKGRTIITGINIPEDYSSNTFIIPNGVYLDFCVTLNISSDADIEVFDFNNTPVVKGAECFAILYTENSNGLSSSVQYLNLPTGVKKIDLGSGTLNFIELAEGVEDLSGVYAHSEIKKSGEFPKSFRQFESMFANCSSLEIPCIQIPDGVTSINFMFNGCQKLSGPVLMLPDSLLSMDNTYVDCVNILRTGHIPNNVRSMKNTYSGALRLNRIENLPEGLIDMCGTFSDTSIASCPKIPNSVQDMTRCFSGCYKLQAMPVLPERLRIMIGTFNRCYSLVTTTFIPNSVVDASDAFSYSPSLQRIRNLPQSLVKMDRMFEKCGNLWASPDLPPLVESACGAFGNCHNMSVPPKLNNGLRFARDMFYGCTRLLVFPVIPGSVEEASGMFSEAPYIQGDLVIFSERIKDIYCINDIIGDNKQNISVYCYENSPLYRTLKRSINNAPNVTLKSIEEHPNYESLEKEYSRMYYTAYSGEYERVKRKK